MAIGKDVGDVLEVFVIQNLNLMINTIASPATSNLTTVTGMQTTASQTLAGSGVPPQLLPLLDSAVRNNFNQLDLKPDLGDISKIFFTLLAPVAPSVTPTTPTTPATSAST